ncbi:IS5/IS1182 family transposase, partial [Pseudomonas sp. Dout3]|nr:IS5/IS1182 family transposase [Pseudomonas sp. Dout3]
TQEGTDNRQLDPMAKAAKEELHQSERCVTADAGYSNGAQFQSCEDAGITAFVPPNRSINTTGGDEQYFDRTELIYDTDNDQYQCPAGNQLTLKQLSKG